MLHREFPVFQQFVLMSRGPFNDQRQRLGWQFASHHGEITNINGCFILSILRMKMRGACSSKNMPITIP
jgi:hypothetical protein